MELLKLPIGEYELNEDLKAELKTEIVFQFGSTYLLNGDNGTGKTSFLKNILIPKIDQAASNTFLFFHTEQDVAIQFYIIKSFYKGLKKSEQNYSTIAEGLKNLKEEYLNFKLYKNKQIVFVLDEIDQFLNINDFIQDLPNENTTLILATHNNQHLKNNGKITTLNFQKVTSELTSISMS